jgi:hypothetical protein
VSDEDVDLIPLVRQRLIRDMLPCDHGYIDVMDVVPASEDVGKVLHAESHARMATVLHFQPFVDMYAILTADIMTEVMFKNLKATIPADDTRVAEAAERWHKVTQAQNREIVRGAVYPILAHMLEAGLIQHGANA